MDTVKLGHVCAAALLGLVGCSGELLGLEDHPTPLATIRLRVDGALQPLRPPETLTETPRLRVALVWGQQWLAEPFCFLPTRSPEAAAVVRAGCRDPFGFAPLRVAGSVAVEPGVEAAIELIDLPAADDMVGDLTGRIAYGSLVVFDDRDGNGTLDLHRPSRELPGTEGDGPGSGHGPMAPPEGEAPLDFVYGASFVTMTAPDLRIAYLEGTFDPNAAFYPRTGCLAPRKGFSVLGAGGLTVGAIFEALAEGRLPTQEAGRCSEGLLEETIVPIVLGSIDEARDVGCSLDSGRGGGPGGGNSLGGTTRYQELPDTAPKLETLYWACVANPTLGGMGGGEGGGGGGEPAASGLEQLVIAMPSTVRTPNATEPIPLGPTDCRAVVHYTLRGCEDDAACETPEWDRTASPPAWWPCSLDAASP